MTNDFNIGDPVTYCPKYGNKEKGIVKVVPNDTNIIFVVYKCNDDWDNYADYTGCATSRKDLVKGWIED